MDTETRPPTFDEFVSTTRQEFSFLEAHGFAEILQPRKKYQNPFEVHYERNGWFVVVEGIDHGFSAGIMIIGPDGRKAPFGQIVPEEYWKKNRDGLGRGQLGDIRYCALTLKEFGQDFLRGNGTILDELCRRTEEHIEKDRQYWRQRKIDRAVTDASEAFRAKDYAKVVRLLEEYEGELPKAQIVKLNFSRKKLNG